MEESGEVIRLTCKGLDEPDAGFELTSCPDTNYNCVAWANGDTTRFWSPTPDGLRSGNYWPEDLPALCSVKVFKDLFARDGFVECAPEELPDGVEAIAIYVSEGGQPEHVARRKADGTWMSKMGDEADIEHQTVGCLDCNVWTFAVMLRKASATERVERQGKPIKKLFLPFIRGK